MSVSGNEPIVPGNDSSQQLDQQGSEGGGHPAWQEILDVLPDSLHSVVRPTLEKWDKGVEERFNTFHQQYDPYKEFVENEVDPLLIQQAMGVLQKLNEDPSGIIGEIIEAFDVQDYIKAEAARQQQQQQQQVQQQSNSGPIIMGNEGTAGSGVPQQPIKMGALSTTDTNNLVTDMLKKLAEQDNS